MSIQQLIDIRCPSCGKLLFKALGPFDIEILCNGIHCKTQAKADGDSSYRLKRLTYPNPAVKEKRGDRDTTIRFPR